MSISRGRTGWLASLSARLVLPNDIMLERKHMRLLNMSSLLKRSDMVANGCGDKQL